MQTFAEIAPLKDELNIIRQNNKKIAFFPTMGNLHEGHLALIRKARDEADIVVVSIFVNPMQFERADELNNCPVSTEDDIKKLITESVDFLFTPSIETMYPDGFEKQSFIEVPGLSHILAGATRPLHFRGATTVTSKLFNIVQPHRAYFGEKDFQQLAVIKKMVKDLAIDIEIVSTPTVRELDGLAMSSKNSLLTFEERQRAPALSRTMRWVGSQVRGGSSDYAALIEDATDQLRAADLQPDYIFIRDAETLQLVSEETKHAVIMIAAFLGSTRLSDNLTVEFTVSKETETTEEKSETEQAE